LAAGAWVATGEGRWVGARSLGLGLVSVNIIFDFVFEKKNVKLVIT
jgi:hypothetical protein